VLLLDEPTASLDPASRRRLFEALRERRARGRAAIVATHVVDEVLGLATRVVVLVGGANEGPPDDASAAIAALEAT
jgi:ABC-2 type transport system ATP-binding protein